MPHSIEPECYPIAPNKLQIGAIDAFQQSYQLLYPVLHLFAIELTIEPGQGVVLIQHAFIKCWITSWKIRSAGYIEGFLRTALLSASRNLTLSFLAIQDHQDHILRQLLSPEIRQGFARVQLYDSLQKMPALETQGLRLVFERHYLKRDSPAAIATEFGIEVKAVEEKLKLAYQTLHLILSMTPCN